MLQIWHKKNDKMIKGNTGLYTEKLNLLVSKVIGNKDIYNFHIGNDVVLERIDNRLTKGSVRLQSSKIVTIPESDKMEINFINSEMP